MIQFTRNLEQHAGVEAVKGLVVVEEGRNVVITSTSMIPRRGQFKFSTLTRGTDLYIKLE